MKRGLLALAAIVVSMGLVFAPAASAAEHVPKAGVAVEVRGLEGHRLDVGERVILVGRLRPFVPGEELKLLLLRDGKVVQRRTANARRIPGKDAGRVTLRTRRLADAGRYTAQAIHQRSSGLGPAKAASEPFRLSFPGLGYGERGAAVRIFHDLLDREGYGNAPGGRVVNGATGRAVHAFRKVNGMGRSESASADVFRRLAAGKGAFNLRYPGAGKHVEVDVSRQVMVLADGGEPRYTYHVSTGKSSTPSDLGKFSFYRKDAGYNSIGMYYSVYYNGGEATHGYASVPDSPASHGCIRNPIPNAVFIYNWIDLGDPIWVYD